MTPQDQPCIDLNADVGELPERLADDREAALIRQLSSANVACGGHAGDGDSMRAVIALCRQAGVAVGAHPSYPDRAHFGRRPVAMSRSALVDSLRQQIQDLAQVARSQGASLSHIKPHGALYHAAADDLQVASALVDVVRSLDDPLPLFARAGSRGLFVFREAGLAVFEEGFADRRYASSCALVERGQPGAVLGSLDQVTEQALGLIQRRSVQAADGKWVEFAQPIATLCLHSDTPGAERLAAGLRAALFAAGITVCRAGPDAIPEHAHESAAR